MASSLVDLVGGIKQALGKRFSASGWRRRI